MHPFFLALASLNSCFTKHGAPQTAGLGCSRSGVALCPPTAQPSTSQPWLPGPGGAHTHPGLPWPGLEEQSLLLDFP